MIITDEAKEQIDKVIAEKNPDKLVRLSCIGGGCSGWQYSMALDDPKEDDEIIGNLCVDPISWGYLNEVTVDYTETLQGSGFVFSNPKATRTCGCGKSFS